MPELLTLQDLANGHLDVKALGEAANGDENTIVTTRTGNTYPSAERAINIMFQNGGLPAEPFATKALMTASALVDGKYAMVTDDTVNNGLYVKTAGNWVKSGYDPIKQANSYTDSAVNTNLYLGTASYTILHNAATMDKSTINMAHSESGITYKNVTGIGGFGIALKDKLRKQLNLWVKVKSVDTNARTNNVKFLLQARNKLGVNSMFEYATLTSASLGWVKLSNKVFTSEQVRDLVSISISPFVEQGATLVVDDFYIGEGSPLDNFIRAGEPKEIQLARATTRKSALPDWQDMPKSDGVTVNRDGDITIAAGKTYSLDIKTDKTLSLYLSTILMQPEFGDCRIFYTLYDENNVQLRTAPFFPAMLNAEVVFSLSASSDISRAVIGIKNFSTTSPITLKSFELCYNRIAPNYEIKNGEVLNRENITSRILKEVNSGTTIPNLSTAPNFEFVRKDENGDRVITNGSYHEETKEFSGIEAGKIYTLVMTDMEVALNGGTAKAVLYMTDSAGASLGGISINLVTGTNIAKVATPATISGLAVSFDITGDATVEAGKMLLTDTPYKDTVIYEDRYKLDATGTIASLWEDPKLSGYTKVGLGVDYQITHEGSDNVLTIPNTAATGYGQGAKWIVKIPDNLDKGLVITFEAKTTYTGAIPTKVWTRYFEKGGLVEFTARLGVIRVNKDGSWALNTLTLPNKIGDKTVDYVEVFLFNAPEATAPLSLKRFIATDGYHNPYINFIKSVGVEEASGLLDFPRLTDALAIQPTNVFSVGRQLFRPLKAVQSTLEDYELIGGRQDLPERLKDKRFVDTKGYKILTITFDDTVYLKKGAALYRTTVDDFVSRCPMGTVVGEENRAVFDDAGLELVTAAMPNSYLRETGNGTLVALGEATAHYSTDKGATWSAATGYVNVEGIFYNGWGTHVSDNVVITSGYKAAGSAGGRGTGKVNFSEDDGKTYKTILDLATSPFIDNAKRGSMHIHSVKYDKWWKGVWVVMGDGAFTNKDSTVQSNIWFIANPSAAVEDIEIISYNTRGAHWLNEQHTSIHLMQDCILFGSDANPTGLHRMARTKNVNAFRDEVKYINGALSHYGCTDYRHKESLPMSVFFGKDGSTAGTYDIIYLTYDGVNFSEIHTEPLTSNASGSKVDSFAYPLDKHFIFERLGDNRFAGNNTWVVGGINYIA